MYAGSVLKAMLGEVTTGVIPRELMTTERIMQRWTVANGTGLPTERWDDSRASKPPALDDDSAYQVDLIVRNCPGKTKRLVEEWCKNPSPTSVIAKKLGMSPRSLEKGWVVALYFLKWKIEATNHGTLLKLLRIHV
jgi:hypothetical protein